MESSASRHTGSPLSISANQSEARITSHIPAVKIDVMTVYGDIYLAKRCISHADHFWQLPFYQITLWLERCCDSPVRSSTLFQQWLESEASGADPQHLGILQIQRVGVDV